MQLQFNSVIVIHKSPGFHTDWYNLQKRIYCDFYLITMPENLVNLPIEQ
jgi:hypothetical protein